MPSWVTLDNPAQLRLFSQDGFALVLNNVGIPGNTPATPALLCTVEKQTPMLPSRSEHRPAGGVSPSSPTVNLLFISGWTYSLGQRQRGCLKQSLCQETESLRSAAWSVPAPELTRVKRQKGRHSDSRPSDGEAGAQGRGFSRPGMKSRLHWRPCLADWSRLLGSMRWPGNCFPDPHTDVAYGKCFPCCGWNPHHALAATCHGACLNQWPEYLQPPPPPQGIYMKLCGKFVICLS